MRNLWIHSFRLRILLGFLSVSGTTMVIAGLGLWYQGGSDRLIRIRSLSEQILLDVVRLQKSEAEFNSRGMVSTTYFATGNHPSLDEHKGSSTEMVSLLGQLSSQLPGAMDDEDAARLRSYISVMVEESMQLQSLFEEYAFLVQQRGFLKYGLMGEMREYAHRMESDGKLKREDVLQLRRHEKDYLLRRDTVYYGQALRLGNALRDQAETRNLDSTVVLMDAYLGRFAELVALEGRLGITRSSGLQWEIAAKSTELAQQVNKVDGVLQEISLGLGARYRRIFIGFAVLAVLLALGLSLYFSIRISRPLRQITEFMRQEAESGFEPSGTFLKVKERGELRALGNDVNGMVRRIRQQLAEIKQQRETLAQRNASLTELNEELRETQERQAALLHVREKIHSIISHDLRAPMNGMEGYLNLLLETPEHFGAEEVSGFARKMLASVKRLSEMMENLLRWSLFHSGELVCKPSWVSLNAAVSRALDLYSEMAARKGLVLADLPPGQWTVYADGEMLDFILRNLVTNAVKFSRPGGKVSMGLQMGEDGWVVVSVTDQGLGMTQEQIDRILVRGEHLTTVGTNREKGTGFGLMLCRDFVVHHGGKLWVESTVGEGTVVQFTMRGQANQDN